MKRFWKREKEGAAGDISTWGWVQIPAAHYNTSGPTVVVPPLNQDFNHSKINSRQARVTRLKEVLATKSDLFGQQNWVCSTKYLE